MVTYTHMIDFSFGQDTHMRICQTFVTDKRSTQRMLDKAQP